MIISKSILTTFEESNIFWARWGSSENSLEPKHYKFQPSLACPNPWIALYLLWGHFFQLRGKNVALAQNWLSTTRLLDYNNDTIWGQRWSSIFIEAIFQREWTKTLVILKFVEVSTEIISVYSIKDIKRSSFLSTGRNCILGNQVWATEYSRDLCFDLIRPLLHRLGHQMHPRQQVQWLLQPRAGMWQLGRWRESKFRETNC